MVSNKRLKVYTIHQFAALVALLMLVIWGLTILWIHLITPAGANMLEMVYVSTLTVIFMILIPLYWKRVRWAYIGGILIILVMFIGAVKGVLNHSIVFSWSLYNLVVILVYVVALIGIYFSIWSYRELAPTGTKKAIFGIGGIFLMTLIIVSVLWFNKDLIHRSMWQLTLNRIDKRLQTLKTLDARIQFLVKEGDLASATAGIVINDSLVWARAYGEVDLNTVYNIGSITKPFVATAILQLYESGLIDLDNDVDEYLPFELRNPEYPQTPITIRMLLTHQSSLAHLTDKYRGYHMDEKIKSWLKEKRGWHLPEYVPYPSFVEFLESYLTPGRAYYTAGGWIAVKPGTKYSYSTPGYDILAYLVECVSGKPFAEYAQDNIFEPLNMLSTGFRLADFSDRLAKPYEHLYSVLAKTNVALPVSNVRTIGGGGMLSTVPDLAQFMIAHMNQGQTNGFQLLRSETIALMQEKAVTFPLGQGDLNQISYGLGIGHIREEPWNSWGHLYDMHGAKGHGGSWFGYIGQMWFTEKGENSYGIILLINTNVNFKAETRDLWLFASPLKIQVLLMEEAIAMQRK